MRTKRIELEDHVIKEAITMGRAHRYMAAGDDFEPESCKQDIARAILESNGYKPKDVEFLLEELSEFVSEGLCSDE